MWKIFAAHVFLISWNVTDFVLQLVHSEKSVLNYDHI
jgi:hypothetical protein